MSGLAQECERLSLDEIAGYAAAAGFSSDSVRIAAAIAMAESGGNTCAHNATPPDDSYGLWQVNMLGPLGPQRRAAFGLRSNDELFDPATNADAAYVISGGGQSFRPWTTYTSGAYRRFVTAADPPPPVPATGDEGSGESGGGNESWSLPPILATDPGSPDGRLSPLALAAVAGVSALVLAVALR